MGLGRPMGSAEILCEIDCELLVPVLFLGRESIAFIRFLKDAMTPLMKGFV